MIEYTIVIPAYNCNESLRELLKDIQQTCKKYKPKEIILADDGSTDDTKFLASIYTSMALPIKHLQCEHKGPFYAEQSGLQAVKTPYAIILHSDLRLRNFSGIIVETKYADTLSVLAYYLNEMDDAAGVSAFSLQLEDPHYIAGGPRSLGRDNLPYSYYREFLFTSLYKVYFDHWQKIYSTDWNIVAIRMECYNQLGFNETFAPYLYYHDDYFARCREIGYQLYFTYDVAAYHPLYSVKPEGSLAVVTHDLYREKARSFLARWNKGAEAWTEVSLRKNIQVQQYFEVNR